MKLYLKKIYLAIGNWGKITRIFLKNLQIILITLNVFLLTFHDKNTGFNQHECIIHASYISCFYYGDFLMCLDMD